MHWLKRWCHNKINHSPQSVFHFFLTHLLWISHMKIWTSVHDVTLMKNWNSYMSFNFSSMSHHKRKWHVQMKKLIRHFFFFFFFHHEQWPFFLGKTSVKFLWHDKKFVLQHNRSLWEKLWNFTAKSIFTGEKKVSTQWPGYLDLHPDLCF